MSDQTLINDLKALRLKCTEIEFRLPVFSEVQASPMTTAQFVRERLSAVRRAVDRVISTVVESGIVYQPCNQHTSEVFLVEPPEEVELVKPAVVSAEQQEAINKALVQKLVIIIVDQRNRMVEHERLLLALPDDATEEEINNVKVAAGVLTDSYVTDWEMIATGYLLGNGVPIADIPQLAEVAAMAAEKLFLAVER